jgi:hypothetical protein
MKLRFKRSSKIAKDITIPTKDIAEIISDWNKPDNQDNQERYKELEEFLKIAGDEIVNNGDFMLFVVNCIETGSAKDIQDIDRAGFFDRLVRLGKTALVKDHFAHALAKRVVLARDPEIYSKGEDVGMARQLVLVGNKLFQDLPEIETIKIILSKISTDALIDLNLIIFNWADNSQRCKKLKEVLSVIWDDEILNDYGKSFRALVRELIMTQNAECITDIYDAGFFDRLLHLGKVDLFDGEFSYLINKFNNAIPHLSDSFISEDKDQKLWAVEEIKKVKNLIRIGRMLYRDEGGLEKSQATLIEERNRQMDELLLLVGEIPDIRIKAFKNLVTSGGELDIKYIEDLLKPTGVAQASSSQ